MIGKGSSIILDDIAILQRDMIKNILSELSVQGGIMNDTIQLNLN